MQVLLSPRSGVRPEKLGFQGLPSMQSHGELSTEI